MQLIDSIRSRLFRLNICAIYEAKEVCGGKGSRSSNYLLFISFLFTYFYFPFFLFGRYFELPYVDLVEEIIYFFVR